MVDNATEGIRKMENVMRQVEVMERQLNDVRDTYFCHFNNWVDALCETLTLGAAIANDAINQASSGRNSAPGSGDGGSQIGVPPPAGPTRVNNVAEVVKPIPMKSEVKTPVSAPATSAGGPTRAWSTTSNQPARNRSPAPKPSTSFKESSVRAAPPRVAPAQAQAPQRTSAGGLATRTHRPSQYSRSRVTPRTQVTRRPVASNVTDEWEAETLAKVQIETPTPILRVYNPERGHFTPEDQ